MRKPRDLDIDLGGAKVLTTKLPPLDAAPAPGPRPNKYGAIPTIYDGIRYDSKAEAERAKSLDAMAELGFRYIRQPTFRLGVPENVYRADFLVWGGDQRVHVEDVKGYRTPKFNRDVKLWKAYGPCQLWILSHDGIEYIDGGWSPR